MWFVILFVVLYNYLQKPGWDLVWNMLLSLGSPFDLVEEFQFVELVKLAIFLQKNLLLLDEWYLTSEEIKLKENMVRIFLEDLGDSKILDL